MFSPEERERIVAHVCNEIVQKRPLYKILAEDAGLCNISTFIKWQSEDEELSAKVARAREYGAAAHIDEMIEIADDASDDAYVDYGKDGEVLGAKINGTAINRAKVMIYAREKAAQMLAPRRFGAKLDVTSDGKALPPPAPAVLVDNRVQTLITLAADRKAIEDERRQLMDD